MGKSSGPRCVGTRASARGVASVCVDVRGVGVYVYGVRFLEAVFHGSRCGLHFLEALSVLRRRCIESYGKCKGRAGNSQDCSARFALDSLWLAPVFFSRAVGESRGRVLGAFGASRG